MGGTATLKIRDTVHRLEARGGQNQLIMFLTGPAGSWKEHCHAGNTAVLL